MDFTKIIPPKANPIKTTTTPRFTFTLYKKIPTTTFNFGIDLKSLPVKPTSEQVSIQRGQAMEDFFKTPSNLLNYEKIRSAGFNLFTTKENLQPVFNEIPKYKNTLLRPMTKYESFWFNLPTLKSSSQKGLLSAFGLEGVYTYETPPDITSGMGIASYSVGRVIGEVTQLVLLSGVASSVSRGIAKILGSTVVLNPALGRFLVDGAGRAVSWGIRGGLEETGREIVNRELSPAKIIKAGLKEVPFGYVSALAGASTRTVQRIIQTGAGFGGYTAFRKILENHKIEKKDIPDILTSIAIGAILAGINAPRKSKLLTKTDAEDFMWAKTKAFVKVGHPEYNEHEVTASAILYLKGLSFPTAFQKAAIEIRQVANIESIESILKKYDLMIFNEILTQAKTMPLDTVVQQNSFWQGVSIFNILIDKIQEIGVMKPEMKPEIKPEVKPPEEVKYVTPVTKRGMVEMGVGEPVSKVEAPISPQEKAKVIAKNLELIKPKENIERIKTEYNSSDKGEVATSVAIKELGNIKHMLNISDIKNYDEILDKNIKTLNIHQKKLVAAKQIPPKGEVKKVAEVKAIPEELKPLAEEARKYKSAEEFMNKLRTLKKQIRGAKTEKMGIKTLPKEDRFLAEVAVGKELQPKIISTFSKKYGYGEKAITDFYNQAVKQPTKAVEKPFTKEMLKTTRPIREGKVGEYVTISSPTYGIKNSKEFNSGIPREGEIVKINPKSVSIKATDNKIYFFPAEAKISNDLTAYKITKPIEKERIEGLTESEIIKEIKPSPLEQKGFVNLVPIKEVFNKMQSFKNKNPEALQKFRETLARVQRTKDQFVEDSNLRSRMFDSFTPEQNLAFIDSLETGQPQADKTLDKVAQLMRQTLDEDYQELKNTKSYVGFVQNYFPHIWKDPQQATQIFSGKSLRGRAPFMKHRIIGLTKLGIEKGLEPVSYNPEELFSAIHLQERKYVIMNQYWTSNQDKKFVNFGDRMPEGYMKVNDSIASVLQFSEKEKGFIQRGFFTLPTQEANMINNYLSPGLQGLKWYRSLRTVKNFTNAIQLGFSGFHALMTGFNVPISGMARGIQNVKLGITTQQPKVLGRGVIQIVRYNPILLPYDIIRTLYVGSKVRTEWFRPGTMSREITDIAQLLESAGGRAKMDTFYSIANKRWGEIFNELKTLRLSSAGIDTILKVVNYIQAPILQQYVPRMKLGVFYDEVKDWTLTHPDASEQEVKIESVKIWDSVDNRFGELVYDNLFWNKTVKDSLMLSIRALGWNIGNVRELGGGAVNLLGGKVTKKSSYLIALFLFMGMVGYLYEKVKGVKIKSILDLYAPRTGKTLPNGSEERIVFPSYAKDVISLAKQGVFTTVKNKLNPDIAIALDIMNNADYYGTEIKSVYDPLYKQAISVLDYILKAHLPFSLQGFQKRLRTGTPLPEALISFLGINPAPTYVTKSNIQNIITDLYTRNLPQTTTKEESLMLQARTDARNKIFNHTATAKDIEDLIQKGYLNEDGAAKFITDSLLTGDIRQFSGLSLADQLRVINLCNAEERKKYIPHLRGMGN